MMAATLPTDLLITHDARQRWPFGLCAPSKWMCITVSASELSDELAVTFSGGPLVPSHNLLAHISSLAV